jgi:hypothetical protein
LLLFDLAGQSIDIDPASAENVNTMVPFEHRAIRPHPQTVAMPRFEGSHQFFTLQTLELREFDLIQRFIPVKRP